MSKGKKRKGGRRSKNQVLNREMMVGGGVGGVGRGWDNTRAPARLKRPPNERKVQFIPLLHFTSIKKKNLFDGHKLALMS